MSAKHTPGPWYSEMNVDGEINTWAFDDPGSPRIGVAKAYKNKNAEANARLIAAAPDLLAALERVLECRRFKISLDTNAAALEQARAAIAKAKGK